MRDEEGEEMERLTEMLLVAFELGAQIVPDPNSRSFEAPVHEWPSVDDDYADGSRSVRRKGR